MLVVADSSPLHLLIEIDHVDVLPVIFQHVAIPVEVASELSHLRAPERVRAFIQNPPTWLDVLAPTAMVLIPELDRGECAAISLAQELDADFVLMDEKAGRRWAKENNLRVIGSLGVLERAAKAGLLDLERAVDRIRKTNSYVSDDLLSHLLDRNRQE